MRIHRNVVLRQFLKEVNLLCNVRKYFDSCLYKIRNFLQIQIFFDCLFDHRQCILIILVIVHSFDVLAVHPTQFLHIKYRRRFIDTVVVKCFYKFFQTKNLAVLCRTPTKQCHIVHNGLRHISEFHQILERRGSVTLGQFFMILVCDRRTMHVNRNIPAKCLV